jgi:hypothetical protein
MAVMIREAGSRESVTSALATGEITPSEAERIANVVDTFVRAIETSDFERRLQIVEAEYAADRTDVPEMFNTGPGERFNL